MAEYDLDVDFMDMTDDRRLVTRLKDATTPGFVPIAGRYVVVGTEDADPAVARILAVDAFGLIDLEILPGSVNDHRHLLTPA